MSVHLPLEPYNSLTELTRGLGVVKKNVRGMQQVAPSLLHGGHSSRVVYEGYTPLPLRRDRPSPAKKKRLLLAYRVSRSNSLSVIWVTSVINLA